MVSRGRRVMSNEEKLSIDEKKRQGMSVQEIAKLFQRSSTTIYNALREIGAMNAAIPPADTTAPAPREGGRATTPMAQSHSALPPPATQQHRLPQEALPLAGYNSIHGFTLELPPAPSNALGAMLAPVPSAAGAINEAAGGLSAVRAAQPRQMKTLSQGLPPPPQQRMQQRALPLEVLADAKVGRRRSEPADPPAIRETTSKMTAPAPLPVAPTEMSVEETREITQAMQSQSVQTHASAEILVSHQQVQAQSLPMQVPVGARGRQSGPVLLVPPVTMTLQNPTLVKDPTATTEVQGVLKPVARAAQQPTEQKVSPPKQTSSVPPPQMPQEPVVVLPSTPAISKPTNGTSATIPLATSGIAAVGNSGPLMGRRSITRPPRVFALTRPALWQKETKGSALHGSQDQGAAAKTATAKSNVTSTQRADRKAETMASPDSDLMSLLLGMIPEDDPSPQTSQEDESTSNQVGNLSQTSNTSSKGEANVCLAQVPLSRQSSDATAAPHGKLVCDDQAKNHPDIETKKRSLQLFLSSLEDQVENLQPEHIGDETSKVYQLLSKLRDELGISNMDTASRSGERKRKRDEDADNMELGKLLHEKMAAEVTLMNIQVQRERAQLDRERMKTEVEAALSRKKLEDASIPKSTIDSIFARTMVN